MFDGAGASNLQRRPGGPAGVGAGRGHRPRPCRGCRRGSGADQAAGPGRAAVRRPDGPGAAGEGRPDPAWAAPDRNVDVPDLRGSDGTSAGQVTAAGLNATAVAAPPDDQIAAPGLGVQGHYRMEQFPLSESMTAAVNVANGNLVVRSTDVSINGPGLGLALDRFYNGLSSRTGALGPQWSVPGGHDIGLEVTATEVVFRAPSGCHRPRRPQHPLRGQPRPLHPTEPSGQDDHYVYSGTNPVTYTDPPGLTCNAVPTHNHEIFNLYNATASATGSRHRVERKQVSDATTFSPRTCSGRAEHTTWTYCSVLVQFGGAVTRWQIPTT